MSDEIERDMQSALTDAIAAIKTLEAQVAELKLTNENNVANAELQIDELNATLKHEKYLLDWLEKNYWTYKNGYVHTGFGTTLKGPTLRSAIEEAMKKESQ